VRGKTHTGNRSSREVVVEPQIALIAVPSAIYQREERDREQSKLYRRTTHQWQAEAGLGALAQVLQATGCSTVAKLLSFAGDSAALGLGTAVKAANAMRCTPNFQPQQEISQRLKLSDKWFMLLFATDILCITHIIIPVLLSPSTNARRSPERPAF
jgi:hypothetical protein